MERRGSEGKEKGEEVSKAHLPFFGFKDTLEETFGLLSEESEAVIMECGKIAFMDPIERKQLLDQYDEYLK